MVDQLLFSILLFLVCFFSWGGSRLIAYFASHLGLVHTPNMRSSHSSVTPHGGGVAIVVFVSIAFFILQLNFSEFEEGYSLNEFYVVMALAFLLAVMGLLDDVFHLSVGLRLLVQLFVVSGLFYSLKGTANTDVVSDYIFFAFLVLAGAWWINLYNFMDGIDGIAAVEALCVLSMAIVISFFYDYSAQNFFVWQFMLLVAAAIAGFLMSNWPPAKVFMGDVGSTWVAFILLAVALLSIEQGLLSSSVWIILVANFVVDTTVTLLVRIARKEKWYSPHRNHLYQIMTIRWQAQLNTINSDENACRTMAHRKAICYLLLINFLWLAPLACLSLYFPALAFVIIAVAYLPLIIAVLWFGIGRRIVFR